MDDQEAERHPGWGEDLPRIERSSPEPPAEIVDVDRHKRLTSVTAAYAVYRLESDDEGALEELLNLMHHAVQDPLIAWRGLQARLAPIQERED